MGIDIDGERVSMELSFDIVNADIYGNEVFAIGHGQGTNGEMMDRSKIFKWVYIKYASIHSYWIQVHCTGAIIFQ